jgi:hypothetical protein
MSQASDDRYALAKAAYGELTQRSFAEPQEATHALTKLSEFFPVCSPGGTTQVAEVAPGHKVLITAHIPQMCDEKGNGGDVFKERSSGTLCFRAVFLKKLAGGIGLEWIPSETRTEFPFRGFPQSGWCVTVHVAGRYRDWSGEWRTVSASKTLDLRDEVLDGTTKTDKQIARERADIASRAETMAKSRCIADACINRTIEADQVGAPIVCAKLYRTDPLDSSAAKAALYGGAREEPIEAHAEIVDEATGEVESKPGVGTSSAPHAPAGSPTRESGPGSGVSGANPATASSPPASAPKEFVIHNPGGPGHNKTFSKATAEELEAYLEFLMGRIASKSIPPAGMPAAKVKAKACADRIDELRAGPAPSIEDNPW